MKHNIYSWLIYLFSLSCLLKALKANYFLLSSSLLTFFFKTAFWGPNDAPNYPTI